MPTWIVLPAHKIIGLETKVTRGNHVVFQFETVFVFEHANATKEFISHERSCKLTKQC